MHGQAAPEWPVGDWSIRILGEPEMFVQLKHGLEAQCPRLDRRGCDQRDAVPHRPSLRCRDLPGPADRGRSRSARSAVQSPPVGPRSATGTRRGGGLAYELTGPIGKDGPMARRDAPLPTGLVTFLLTDIEGLTQAWQTAPDDMTAIVSRHYQYLDAAVATRGGVRPQEQGEGDSIVAVFVDPVAAVTTALEAQLALRRELPDLPVRMALHTGETMLRNEDNYVGLTIIRCARIRSSGHGGQILLSDEDDLGPSTVRSPTAPTSSTSASTGSVVSMDGHGSGSSPTPNSPSTSPRSRPEHRLRATCRRRSRPSSGDGPSSPRWAIHSSRSGSSP